MLFMRGPKAFIEAMGYSYHTGIPLIQNFSPRQSFTHSLSSIQLMSNPCIMKSRLADMNEKPLLFLVSTEKLRAVEQHFLKNRKPFYSDIKLHLFAVPVSDLTDAL